MSLQRLLDIGFILVGEWQSSKDTSLKFKANGVDLLVTTGGILYAFVIDGEVLYIGKSVKSFADRFKGYAKPGPTQGTNLRISPLIREAISSGRRVEVYGFSKFDDTTYPGFRLSHAAGLEDSLISVIKPIWNVSGNKKKV